jgi:hypothetical protein
MRELEYSRKYADGFIAITTYNVIIEAMKKDQPLSVVARDSFRLRLLGYPSEHVFKLESFIENSSDADMASANNMPKYSSGEEFMNVVKEASQ